MAALIIPNNTTFGSMTNQTVGSLLKLNTTMARLQDALATASAGYVGTPGTQYEAGNMTTPGNMFVQNNFGIAPDQAEAGKNGTDYEFAVNTLAAAWTAFWTAAEASVNQLDNGSAF
jgi:hypothetical protein